MKIEDIKYSIAEIPFEKELKHSRKVFNKTESIILRVRIDGVDGFGEGCPRAYVTGNTIEQASKIVSCLRSKLISLNFSEPKELVEDVKTLTKDNSVRAAFDLAITDAYCKLKGLFLHQYLGAQRRSSIQYDAGIPIVSLKETINYAKKFYSLGLRRFKLKSDSDINCLEEKLEALRQEFSDIEIKIDANSIWSPKEAVAIIGRIEKYDILLVEDPIDSKDFEGILKVRRSTDVPLMADEALVSDEDLQRIIQSRTYDWFNLKLSKNGGVHEAKRILETAKNNGIKVQLGSHYGECGILESARRQFGCTENYISSFEGANRMLLESDIVTENLKPSANFKGDLSYLSGYGLGIHLKENIQWK